LPDAAAAELSALLRINPTACRPGSWAESGATRVPVGGNPLGHLRMIKPSEQALNDFEEAGKWPMLALSVAIIPLLVIPLVMQLSETQRTAFAVVDVVIWVLFAAECFVRLCLAPRKRHFIVHNILDLALVVVPFLRSLRAMRALRTLRLLRLATALLFVARGIKASRRFLPIRYSALSVMMASRCQQVRAWLLQHACRRGGHRVLPSAARPERRARRLSTAQESPLTRPPGRLDDAARLVAAMIATCP